MRAVGQYSYVIPADGDIVSKHKKASDRIKVPSTSVELTTRLLEAQKQQQQQQRRRRRQCLQLSCTARADAECGMVHVGYAKGGQVAMNMFNMNLQNTYVYFTFLAFAKFKYSTGN